MTCNMTYYTHGDDARVNPGPDIFPSIDWEPGAGTPFYTTVTFLRSTGATPVVIGRIMQADMGTIASGEVIPSYNCTTSLTFSNGAVASTSYALNSVSWTCRSAPVRTWCKYTVNIYTNIFYIFFGFYTFEWFIDSAPIAIGVYYFLSLTLYVRLSVCHKHCFFFFVSR